MSKSIGVVNIDLDALSKKTRIKKEELEKKSKEELIKLELLYPLSSLVNPFIREPLGNEKLLEVLSKLVSKGHTIVLIEHNLDIVKSADYIIDIGPEGGVKGGNIVAKGTPEEVAETDGSYTGEYLARVLKRKVKK